MRDGERLLVQAMRPYLQAKTGLHIFASGSYPITGVLHASGLLPQSA